MKSVSLLFACLCLLVQTNQARNTHVQLDNSITLKAKMPNSESIEFTVTAPDFGWVAFGFGNTMNNSDVFLIKAEGKRSIIIDGHSLTNKMLLTDEINDYSLSTVTIDGINTYTVTRLFDTGDVQDFNIIDGDNQLMYAYGNDVDKLTYKEGDGGELALLVYTPMRDIGLKTANTDPSIARRRLMDSSGLAHALITYIIWGVLSFLLVVTGRYAKYFYSIRLWIHGLIGIIVLILNIIASGVKPSHSDSANALGDNHTSIAGIITAFTIGECVIGVAWKALQLFLRHWTKVTQLTRMLHMFFGFFLIVYAHFGILSGLYLYDSPITWLFYLHIALTIVLYAVIEVLFQLKSKWKYQDLESLEKKNLKEITLDEFDQLIKNGKKYWLMDKYVIDVSWYRFEHPGSTSVFDQSIGKDVGKYFYGSYSMEDWVKPWTHSYMAGLIVKKLVIAKIVEPRDKGIVISVHTDQGNWSIQDSREHGENSFDKPSNIYYVKDKQEIMKDIFRFKLHNSQVKVKSYYPNLDQAGRGYIINSPWTQVSRYYTICNCMNEKYYDIYMDAFNSVINGTQRTNKLPDDRFYEECDSFIEFVIKVYHQTKKGVAKQLWEALPDKPFVIDGPLGKGLDFGFPHPAGTFLLFVGGTGILPFMDIFAYLARRIIAKKSQDGPILPGETFEVDLSKAKFIVYAYYTNPENACGYEFTKQVADVFKKYGASEQFEFRPKFTRAGDKRLNKEDLVDLLSDHAQKGGVDRLWVCGPPSMNNMFHRYMVIVKRTLNISKDKIDIL